jgi:hypothetical protein
VPDSSEREERYLSTTEVADVCGVTRGTVARWVRLGLLPGTRRQSRGKRSGYLIPSGAAREFARKYDRQKFWSERRASKLTESAVIDIRRRLAAGEDLDHLVAEYGVTPSHVRRVGYGCTWAHVGGPRITPAPHAKLDENCVLDIRQRYAAGESARCLAEQYDVTIYTIHGVCRGLTWKHVGGPLAQARRCTILSDEQVRMLREEYAVGRANGRRVTLATLAARYHVSESTVSRLVRGKRRREAGGPISGGRPD